MPESRYVPSKRLRPLLVYLAAAFAVIVLVDAALERLAPVDTARQILVLAWIVLFPLGGWWVWRRG